MPCRHRSWVCPEGTKPGSLEKTSNLIFYSQFHNKQKMFQYLKIFTILTAHSIVRKSFAEFVAHDEEDGLGIFEFLLKMKHSIVTYFFSRNNYFQSISKCFSKFHVKSLIKKKKTRIHWKFINPFGMKNKTNCSWNFVILFKFPNILRI